MAANVPATALARYRQTFQPSALFIGSNGIFPGFQSPDTPANWFVVVSLTDLSVAVNTTSQDPTAVPQDVQQYLGNTNYFLFFMTNAQTGPNVPQGPLYTFLQQVGSGPQLENLEQIISQQGTGIINTFSYILAATMDTQDMQGFEATNLYNYAILPMQFMPVQVGGQTIYAPIKIG